ncbi:MAG: DNA polymerase III subunit delta' [Halothiobacillaceae bacterium]|jgi:DNA polymerase-3 subunit delta'
MSHALHPWLEPLFEQLAALAREARLPHALLLAGPEGVGKGRLARRLAQAVLCHAPGPGGQPCDQCASCRPFLAGAHPDFTQLEPDEPGKPIKVDAVRDFCAALQLTSQFSHGKVGILEPAEAMNLAASNSLLKTLEEPPAGTLIILVTAQPSRLPVTVRSRCQRWTVGVPEREAAAAWLARQPQVAGEDPGLLLDLVEGRPLAALNLAAPERLASRTRWLESLLHLLRAGGNPLALAAATDKAELSELVHWSTLLVADLLRLQAGVGEVVNRDLADLLPPVARRIDARGLFGLYDHLLELAGLVNHPLNRDLLLEDLLLRFDRLGGRS